MISFLSLNVSEVFDNVSHIFNFFITWKKKVSSKLLKWMKDFLKNKNIILIIKKYTQTKCWINVNILQNFLLSSILYLFYNANLLKTCENVKLCFSVTNFENNINILIYSEFIKRNCDVLKKTWNKVFKWTEKHEFKFNKQKHELIYFSKTLKKYNMKISITLRKHRMNANINFKTLKVQLNFKLRWSW